MKVKLPFPLTGNGKSRIRRRYITATRTFLLEQYVSPPVIRGDVTAHIVFCPPDNSQAKQRRDLDNLAKPVLDSIKGILIEDDSRIKLLIAEMIPPEGDGFVSLSILPKPENNEEHMNHVAH